ncbi:hypothetical protein [Campylobacter concisus]|jgi:hypothetical protein|uniref:hypothetical protein n=3 Tax=Campylobacter concisus TaxID=199 RepID=UPI000CD9275D|nr:hypothetical protein [Campylobacter concisus]
MIKIDKSEILKYLVENMLDKNLLTDINTLIDDSIKSLKIDIMDNKISFNDAEKVVKYIQDGNIFKSLTNKAIKEKQAIAKSGGGFWFGAIVAGAIAYGGYEMFLERYSIEQEYAFISTCVGEQSSSYRKGQCIEKIKRCLKEDKKFSECSMF